jgi:hypothetical protein
MNSGDLNDELVNLHACHKTGRKRAKITMSPDGMLAHSNQFQQTCEINGFEVDMHDTEADFECVFADTQGKQRWRIHQRRTSSDG